MNNEEFEMYRQACDGMADLIRSGASLSNLAHALLRSHACCQQKLDDAQREEVLRATLMAMLEAWDMVRRPSVRATCGSSSTLAVNGTLLCLYCRKAVQL